MPVDGRSAMIPAWFDQASYHDSFRPGPGISFALGARDSISRTAEARRSSGDGRKDFHRRPCRYDNPSGRKLKFATVVSEWLDGVDRQHSLPARDRLSSISSSGTCWSASTQAHVRASYAEPWRDRTDRGTILPPDSLLPDPMLSSLSQDNRQGSSSNAGWAAGCPRCLRLMQRTVSSQMFGRMAPRINSICLLGSLPQ